MVKRKYPRRVTFPIILTGVSVIMIIAAIVLLSRYGSSAYFAMTGKPLNFHGAPQSTVQAESLPHFVVTGSIANKNISVGETQTITITAKADKSTSAVVNAWITSPTLHKQVWRSPEAATTKFPANKIVTSTYSYVIKPTTQKPGSKFIYTLPSGIYKLSASMKSTDGYTDYASKQNLAEYTLQ